MKSAWSLEDELLKLSDQESLAEALMSMGLIESHDERFELASSPIGWYRSGAETYLYRFCVRRDRAETELVLKACVGFSPGTSPDQILESWVGRRKLLSGRGVLTPKLFGWGGGLLLEEYVPFHLREALESHSANPDHLLLGLSELGGIVASLGFMPVQLFEDLRSHGHDVVFVDFGQDLGPPYVSPTIDENLFEKLLNYLNSLGLAITSPLLRNMRQAFEAKQHRTH